ncbi:MULTISPECIES: DUF1499 domain-containing protein [Methylobacterium]|uniref:DUF1499 domain-containing protein n=2 Tax=Pseudomonadota TaxID=1224 RepID=A0ABQ4SR72_9HYPH|nr:MULTISPECIES: DUF1499 domain-containing protein [Methylobacterium]PIU05893.1 MAG: DUF1499 domain-containing protein [Methylobacterium sp. CG09_land_8_20_14_0_10_71_15]PIU12739.1 MAG: DUF1499 domain-containing protein [Methylobacterium sp. CG08_land_8_20_14_0_20_71_15]GBU18749.1 hypothetical protein AwMethylo_29640 [Methylobacterium sp.]GJE05711.1 hypothetical protein AOPFMNJM_1017 [Methylobacterium jeotgali]
MRRLLAEEPVTRAGPLSRRVALFALAATLIALLLVRDQRADGPAALAALGAGLAAALLAALLALFAFVRIWREGARGLGGALAGLFVAGLVLAYPAYASLRGLRLPAIADVSTDTENPPAFSRSRAAFAARDGRYPPDPGPAAREAQRKAYPQVASLSLDIDADMAFELARKAAVNRRWQIVEAIRPGGRVGNGRIEAVARGLILNRPDDVTVRVRPRADGTRIDVRSASRIGARDLGANADRVRAYLDEVANLALAVK